MFKAVLEFLKNLYSKNEENTLKEEQSKKLAKQRLHILLVQDRASVSADFIDLMKKEVIDVIKKYVVFKEEAVEIDITTSVSNDGEKTETGLFLKIPIENIRNEMKSEALKQEMEEKEKLFIEKKNDALNHMLITEEDNVITDDLIPSQDVLLTENIAVEMEVTEEEIRKITKATEVSEMNDTIEKLEQNIKLLENITENTEKINKEEIFKEAKKISEKIEEENKTNFSESFKEQYEKIFKSDEPKEMERNNQLDLEEETKSDDEPKKRGKKTKNN